MRSIEELAHRSGESLNDLRRWHELGVLCDLDADDADATGRACERIRLLRVLERRGLSADVISRIVRDNAGLIDRLLEPLEGSVPGDGGSLDEVLAERGIDPDTLSRVVEAAGLQDVARMPSRDDLLAFRSLQRVIEGGFPEAALVQLMRVYADAFARIADAEVRLHHMYVHEQLRRQGLSGPELMEATEAIGRPLEELIEPTLLYFHRHAWRTAMREDAVTHLLQESGLEELLESPGQLQRAVLFIDLSSFTPLTAAMGDEAAVQVLDVFSLCVRDTARAWGGTVVKQIGDSFLVVFADSASAIRAALEIDRKLGEEQQPPAVHAGVHYGPVLYREGDYVGSTVNVAARLLSEAGRHEIIVTGAARANSHGLPEATFVSIGSRQLRGFDEPVELYRVGRTTTSDRVVDPVCGMELLMGEAAASIRIDEAEHFFCSSNCLDVFVRNR